MYEWIRIFSDRKRRLAILSIPLVCLCLFFYQKCGGNFGALLTDARDYRQMLSDYQDKAPEEIVEILSQKWNPSGNERLLLAQGEHLAGYGAYLERVQKQAQNMQMSSLFSQDKNSFVYKNILKTAQDFAGCSTQGVRLGNDRAITYWLSFSLADWGFLAGILLLVMSFLEERQKGLTPIVRTCPRGRQKLQATRLVILLGFSLVMTLVLYALPLGISLILDGGWQDLSRPMQSVAAFGKCTAQLTLWGFLGQFFLVKVLCGFLLGVLLWFLLGFLEQVQLRWLVTGVGLAVEYLLFTLIPAPSIFSPLRYLNVFSYVFPFGLYTQYVNINFFTLPVGQRPMLLGLLAVLTLVLGGAVVWIQSRRFPFGNRDRLGKVLHLWNRLADVFRRHLGMLGFEWYKLLFLSAGGIFLVLGMLLPRNLYCNANAYGSLEDSVYRQYLAQVQGPITEDTYRYIQEAEAALADSQMENTGDFQMALERLKQTVAEAEEGQWLVDDVPFLNFFGEKGWRTQRKTALLSMLILVVSLTTLFASDHNGDVRKVLRSTPAGRGRLFWCKYAVALGITALAYFLVFGKEWQQAVKYIGDLVLSAPAFSIPVLKGYTMTVGGFVTLLFVAKAVAMLLIMHLCIFIAERSGSFDKAFVISAGALLLPAAAYHFGADFLEPFTPLSFLSDGNILLGGTGIFFLLWFGASFVALWLAQRHWCRS